MVGAVARARDGAPQHIRAGDHVRSPRVGPLRPAPRRANARGPDGRRARGDGRRRLREAAICGTLEGGPMAVALRRHPPRPHPRARPLRHLRARHLGARTTSGRGPPRSATPMESSSTHWGEGSIAGRVAPSQHERPPFMEWAGRLERLAASPSTIRRIFELIGSSTCATCCPRSGRHARDAPDRGQLHQGRALPLHRRRRSGRSLRGARGRDNMFALGDSEALHGRDRGVPHGHAARARARPNARDGDVHRHRRLHSRAAEMGDRGWRFLLGRHDRSSGGHSNATAAARSSTRETASWPPSTGRPGRSAARRRWPRRWGRSAWRFAPGFTRASAR